MNRSEKRRSEREDKKKKVTYTLTQEQLDSIVAEKISAEIVKAKKEATEDAINAAMLLLLVLPMEVLMDHYWTKSYSKRIPEFTDHVIDYYQRWQKGELDMEKMKEDLWEYGGVRFEEERTV